MTRTIQVLADKGALVAQAAVLVGDRIRQTLAQQEYCTIALAGGSTPKPLYEAIAQQDLPWERLHIFWGDERYVPADHPDSNEGMARAAWLDHVAIPAENIHPMPTHSGDPATDAAQHNQDILDFFQTPAGEFPQFDIILLGMGDDGHTASLFPHTEALQLCDRAITVGNKDGQPRLTFTVPLLNRAKLILFLVAGANKQTALNHVFAPEDDSNQYPSRLVHPAGEAIWLLDQAAAEGVALPDRP
ncbi:6-phosphogluconolactonase [Spirulina major CS-329]|uniref:6-phosphogluconolactonase n=1 Tax=Spirulina TaxID=1154 RepID=UPI0023312ECC|nr:MULTISPECIES: 6-phosphogluconolactonase [Spirulina]MDB9494618.1 6-phosphogluconolactonase [Spirulina subsalsa CS-330]MDB9505186.1 6-phosphogluconolactonase [Spirulina major CS-329]